MTDLSNQNISFQSEINPQPKQAESPSVLNPYSPQQTTAPAPQVGLQNQTIRQTGEPTINPEILKIITSDQNQSDQSAQNNQNMIN